MSLFPLLFSFVIAAITLTLGAVLFGLHLHWATVPLSLPAMALALLSFLPFGLLFAALTVTVKQGSVGISWVVALLSILGGLYFPVALLPAWLRQLAQLQPFGSATGLLRRLLVDANATETATHAIVKLSLFAAVLVPISIGVLSIAIKSGQRTGTIIEY